MTPNLFILGAGKCGTTSLHHALAQHPDIHASRIKEPTFFCYPFQVVKDPISYFKLFDSDKRYRMESSHAYLSNPETAPVLRACFPEARLIVILRQPKARAYSLYRHMRRARRQAPPFERLASFEAALRAEDRRFRSPSFAKHCPQYFWNFMYCRSSSFDQQLSRYLALFDRSQLHVLTLAEFVAKPVAQIEQVMRFLGLNARPVASFDFQARNVAERYGHYSAAADKMMSAALDGTTDRVDEIVGRALDWSC